MVINVYLLHALYFSIWLSIFINTHIFFSFILRGPDSHFKHLPLPYSLAFFTLGFLVRFYLKRNESVNDPLKISPKHDPLSINSFTL